MSQQTRRQILAGTVAICRLRKAGYKGAGDESTSDEERRMSFDGAQLSRRGFMAAAIAAAEAARPHTGRTVTASLTAAPTRIDIGGPIVTTLAYGNTIPGQVIRATVGDELVVTVKNQLDHPTSVHWHGIALRNDMDGANRQPRTLRPVR